MSILDKPAESAAARVDWDEVLERWRAAGPSGRPTLVCRWVPDPEGQGMTAVWDTEGR